MKVIAKIQDGNDAYMRKNQPVRSRAQDQERQDRMLAEDHHPTDNLEMALRLSGRPKPSFKFTAHHITSGKGKLDRTRQTRIHMHLYGIGINDADNGVWMLMEEAMRTHWHTPEAQAHKKIHTHNYER